MRNLWAIGEFEDGTLSDSLGEVLGCFREVTSKILCETNLLLVGSNLMLHSPVFGRLGQPITILIESEVLVSNEPGLVAREVANLALERKPQVIACTNSQWGLEVASHIAGRLVWPLITDVIGCEIDGDDIIVHRLAFGGQHKNSIRLPESAVVTIHPHTFAAPRPAEITTSLEKLEAAVSMSMVRKFVERIEPSSSEGPSLADAQVIVSGGRGMGSPNNFELLRKLASKLGAAYGASRAVVDAGWVEPSHQVGLTGKVVSPRLYIACGISGADQHLAGMRTSDIIVAINRDPDAPIFKHASFGIVGDCIETIQALLEQLG